MSRRRGSAAGRPGPRRRRPRARDVALPAGVRDVILLVRVRDLVQHAIRVGRCRVGIQIDHAAPEPRVLLRDCAPSPTRGLGRNTRARSSSTGWTPRVTTQSLMDESARSARASACTTCSRPQHPNRCALPSDRVERLRQCGVGGPRIDQPIEWRRLLERAPGGAQPPDGSRLQHSGSSVSNVSPAGPPRSGRHENAGAQPVLPRCRPRSRTPSAEIRRGGRGLSVPRRAAARHSRRQSHFGLAPLRRE